jgi:hypothetical protein
VASLAYSTPGSGTPQGGFVCAWCRAPLASDGRPPSARENYGICPACLRAELAALRAAGPARRPVALR